jgi:hypothetical protein
MVRIWDLVHPLVVWTLEERSQRLFALCVQVQARLMARYPGYQPLTPHTVPEAVAAEVKEMLDVLVRRDRGRGIFPDARRTARATRGL